MFMMVQKQLLILFTYRTFDGIEPGNTVTVTIQITPVMTVQRLQTQLPDINVQEDAEDSVFSVSSVFDDVDRVGGIPDNLSYSVTHTGAGIATVTLKLQQLQLIILMIKQEVLWYQ